MQTSPVSSDVFPRKVPRSAVPTPSQIMTRIKQQYPGVDVYLTTGTSPRSLILNRIVVHPARQRTGLGSAVMTEITQLADHHGLTLSLCPSTHFGETRERLVAFYQRFGFIINDGDFKRDEIAEEMYRLPHAIQERRKP